MAEYIERTALRDALYSDDAITMQGVKILNQFPAADVAPVVHGRWLKNELTHIENVFICNLCQRQAFGMYERTPYCPNCGARMDLGGADND